jgi:hypothetical protein
MSTLNSLEGVTAFGELFLQRPRKRERRWDSDFARPRFLEEYPEVSVRPLAVFRYLESVYRTPGSVGFKLMYSQLRSYPEILAYLIARRVAVVHLVRDNYLDVLISSELKAHMGKAHILEGQERPGDLQVELELQGLVERLARIESKFTMGRRLMGWLPLRCLELRYDDLRSDPAHFERLWDFLGVNAARVSPSSNVVRIRESGHAAVVSNYAEVKKILADSPYHAMTE